MVVASAYLRQKSKGKRERERSLKEADCGAGCKVPLLLITYKSHYTT
jgi:hypothetical protein